MVFHDHYVTLAIICVIVCFDQQVSPTFSNPEWTTEDSTTGSTTSATTVAKTSTTISYTTPPSRCNVTTSCPGDELGCQLPDEICLPKSNRCDGEIDCPVTASDEVSCPQSDETFCPDDFEHVLGANDGYCYHLKNMSEGPVHFPEALAYCLTLNAFLVRPNSLAQVEALADYLDITEDVIAGYWMGYKRRSAPRVNGTLSPENASIRKDKTEFYDIYSQCPRIQMPEELWRVPNQPGEKTDERDEQCVAKKRPGKKAPAKFVGADDYSCVIQQQHYVICEKCQELLPTP